MPDLVFTIIITVLVIALAYLIVHAVGKK